MAASNTTSPHPSTFILLGIPGLEVLYVWISIPFCSVYILSLLGNCLLLAIIKMEPSLHKPMYLFLSMLSIIHLAVTSIMLPKTLCIFWFNDQDIHIDACLTQMYLVHSLGIMESGFIAAMAFDRYVAICNPLRHSDILNSRTITKICFSVVLRGFLLMAPYPFLLKQLSYCETTISHTFCEVVVLIKMSCADPSAMRVHNGLTFIFLMAVVDFILIVLSYILILRAVFKLPSKEARLTSLSTCGPHICIIAVAYTSGSFSFFTSLFGHSVPLHVHIIVANFYMLSPSVLDPIIYGVKTKKIRESVLRVFSVRGFHTFS